MVLKALGLICSFPGFLFLKEGKNVRKQRNEKKRSPHRHLFHALKLTAIILLSACLTASAKPGKKTPFIEKTGKKEMAAPLPIDVVGMVKDSTGNPLAGATVALKGTKIATKTDANGNYSLSIPNEGGTLVISYTGYNTKEIPVTKSGVFNAVLSLADARAEEVIITAYGQKQERKSIAGSITTVTPENIKIPSSNLTNALPGAVAGIIGFQPGGQPGYNNTQFFIRGVTTFGYNSSPLILIDNIESSSTDLANLQVDDIASFSILKDASATALYGARGANGVLLVNTKRGANAKAQIYLKFENSISTPTKQVSVVDPVRYMNLYNEALLSRDLTAVPFFDEDKLYNTQQVLDNANGSNKFVYPAVDWLDQLFKNHTSNQRANLSIRGGGNVATYYVSGSYNLDNGILNVNHLNNFNNNVKLQNAQFRSNVDIKVTNTTKVGLLLSGNFNDYNGPITSDPSGSSDLWKKIMYASPVLFPAYFEPDTSTIYNKWVLFGNSSGLSSGNSLNLYDNPYADMLRGYSQYSQSTMNAQINMEQDLKFITRGLKFQAMYYTQRYSYFNTTRQYNPYYYEVGLYDRVKRSYVLNWINSLPEHNATAYLNYSPGSRTINTQTNLQGLLTYDRTFGPHRINATGVVQRQEILQTLDGGDGVNTLLQLSLPHRNLNSALRLSYTYDDRYVIEPSVAYNGSERFDKGHRFGLFPTIGAAWNVSNEKFWGNGIANIITRLKLRGSYGLVGNDAIAQARFFYLSSVDLGGGAPATFGVAGQGTLGLPGVSISNYANPAVTWDLSKQADVGIDLTLFNSWNLAVDFYNYNRSQIYQNRIGIATLGLEAAVGANLGTASTRGVDIQTDYNKVLNEDWSFVARGNFTFAKSRYGKYEEPDYPYPWMYRSGTAIGQQFGFVAERLFVDDAEVANSPSQSFIYQDGTNSVAGNPTMGGDIKYKDINNDGVINNFDKVPLGYPTVPEITYGFGGSIKYKKFDLNFFFHGNARVSLFIDPSLVSPFIQGKDAGSGVFLPSTNAQVLTSFADNHWSLQNQNLYAEYPRLGTKVADMANNLQSSSWWMRDGTFLRLKTLELGYSLPANLLNRLHMKDARLYVSGLNLLNFSKFNMWDVEQGGNGFAYPIQRVYNVGINVTFN